MEIRDVDGALGYIFSLNKMGRSPSHKTTYIPSVWMYAICPELLTPRLSGKIPLTVCIMVYLASPSGGGRGKKIMTEEFRHEKLNGGPPTKS